MNVTEARSLFRDYVDDPDGTFLTDAQVNQYLDFGLGDWLKFIRQHRPDLLLTFVNLTAANGASYTSQPASAKPVAYALNLNDKDIIYPGKVANTPLMGSYVDTSAGPGSYVALRGPIDTISNLYRGQSGPDSEQTRTWRLMPVSRGESLNLSNNMYNYMLQKQTLMFNGGFPDNLIIEYFPQPRTVFADATTDVSQPIEDGFLPQFHELIVLMATTRYFIRDGQPNQMVSQQMASSQAGLLRYLQDGQLTDGFDRVTVTHLF